MGRTSAEDGPSWDKASKQWRRDTGWRASGSGQHRFYLGRDELAARIRCLQLAKLWEGVGRRWVRLRAVDDTPRDALHMVGVVDVDSLRLRMSERAVWDPTTMAIAQAVAKGECVVRLAVPLLGLAKHGDPPGVAMFMADAQLEAKSPASVAEWLRQLRADCGVIRIELADERAQAQAQAIVDVKVAQAQAVVEQAQAQAAPAPTPTGQTLHMALDAFSRWIGLEYVEPGSNPPRPTPYAVVRMRYVGTLKQHVKDIQLDAFGLDSLEEWVRYWRYRPNTAKGEPFEIETVKDILKLINRFTKWLHRSTHFRWRRPEDWEGTSKAKIIEFPGEMSKKRTGTRVATYSVEELGTVYRAAGPWLRALMTLALNHAFGRAELAGLLEDEVHLDDEHPWIGRLRGKTSSYGEWRLWPQSVAAIQWLRAHKRKLRAKCPQLIVKQRVGQPLKSSKAGNASSEIGNAWGRLLKRLAKDNPRLRKLSWNKLRKTSADMVREIAGGEVASIHLSHGSKATKDSLLARYTNPQWARLHEAVKEMGERLAPVFDQPLAHTPGTRKEAK